MGEGHGSTTSVWVHQAPGGNSSFSLAGDHWGYEPPQPKNVAPVYQAPVEEQSAKVVNQHYSSSLSFEGYGDYEPPRSQYGKARVQEFKHDNVWTGDSQMTGAKG